MTTEKHDPWALLREAREDVDAMGNGDLCRAIDRALALHDAALAEGCPDCGHQYGQQEYCQGDGHAEHADSDTPVAEWEQRQGSYIHDDGVNELRVYLWGDEWHWHTVVEYRADGTCATEAEAKSAAIAAARGLK